MCSTRSGTGRFGGNNPDDRRSDSSDANRARPPPASVPAQGQRRGLRLGRIGGLVHRLAGGANQPFRFELGKGLVVLLPAPINHVALVNDGRWSEKLVQALLDQRVFAAFLIGNRTIWRAWWRRPSRALVLADGHRASLWHSKCCQLKRLECDFGGSAWRLQQRRRDDAAGVAGLLAPFGQPEPTAAVAPARSLARHWPVRSGSPPSPVPDPNLARSRAHPWFFLSGFSFVPALWDTPRGPLRTSGALGPALAVPMLGHLRAAISAGSAGRSGNIDAAGPAGPGEVSLSLQLGQVAPGGTLRDAGVHGQRAQRTGSIARRDQRTTQGTPSPIAGAASAGGRRQRQRGQRQA